jgi:hypothetical protein
MEKGAIYSSSTRQKINTRSSTEGELVGVNDTLPQIVWTRNFLKAQCYDVGPCDVFQDSQSAMLLEKNGKASSSRRTRHINIRYFFVTDRVAKGEVVIKYCPTKEMLADFFTKPLQGTPFRKFRDAIMNIDPASYPAADHRSVLEHGAESSTIGPSKSVETAMAQLNQKNSNDSCNCINDPSDSCKCTRDPQGHDDGWTLVCDKRNKRSYSGTHSTIRQEQIRSVSSYFN